MWCHCPISSPHNQNWKVNMSFYGNSLKKSLIEMNKGNTNVLNWIFGFTNSSVVPVSTFHWVCNWHTYVSLHSATCVRRKPFMSHLLQSQYLIVRNKQRNCSPTSSADANTFVMLMYPSYTCVTPMSL